MSFLSKLFVVLCLVVLVSVAVVPMAYAGGPGGNQKQGWVAKAKAKVWGSNGSNGTAARAATAMGKNGVSLPSGPSKGLQQGYNTLFRIAEPHAKR